MDIVDEIGKKGEEPVVMKDQQIQPPRTDNKKSAMTRPGRQTNLSRERKLSGQNVTTTVVGVLRSYHI